MDEGCGTAQGINLIFYMVAQAAFRGTATMEAEIPVSGFVDVALQLWGIPER